MIALFWLWGPSALLSNSGCTSLHSCQRCARAPLPPHLRQHFISSLLDNSHSDVCEMITPCGFGLYCPDHCWCLTSFYVSVSHIGPLSDIWFAITLSHSADRLLILSMASFACSFLVWYSPTCFALLLLLLFLVSDSKKSPRPMSRSLSLRFSSRSFMVSDHKNMEIKQHAAEVDWRTDQERDF